MKRFYKDSMIKAGTSDLSKAFIENLFENRCHPLLHSKNGCVTRTGREQEPLKLGRVRTSCLSSAVPGQKHTFFCFSVGVILKWMLLVVSQSSQDSTNCHPFTEEEHSASSIWGHLLQAWGQLVVPGLLSGQQQFWECSRTPPRAVL